MNPHYLWLADVVQLLTLFVVGPVLAIAIVYAAWRGKLQSFYPERTRAMGVAAGVAAILLFGIAKWINADVRTAQYFLQLACVLLSGLLFGICGGCISCELLRIWRWHKTTQLRDDGQNSR